MDTGFVVLIDESGYSFCLSNLIHLLHYCLEDNKRDEEITQ